MSRLRLLLALESRRILSLRLLLLLLLLLLLSRQAGRQDSLNPVTTVMYHMRETVMMGEKKQKRRNFPWDSFHGKSHT